MKSLQCDNNMNQAWLDHYMLISNQQIKYLIIVAFRNSYTQIHQTFQAMCTALCLIDSALCEKVLLLA